MLGYEVSTRIGVVMGRPHYQFWHNTGTMGSFGAAAAAGSLLRLNEDAFAHALALAATFTAGLQQAFRTEAMAKPLHAGPRRRGRRSGSPTGGPRLCAVRWTCWKANPVWVRP